MSIQVNLSAAFLLALLESLNYPFKHLCGGEMDAEGNFDAGYLFDVLVGHLHTIAGEWEEVER